MAEITNRNPRGAGAHSKHPWERKVNACYRMPRWKRDVLADKAKSDGVSFTSLLDAAVDALYFNTDKQEDADG
ncbi:MAG: hypothetical protein KAJ19_13005 [Gammaproteobacteria bacterium]|nr:hypothetical protein [Gammaproteobacteria bacterium]